MTRRVVLAVPVLIGLLGPAGCEHSRALPLGPTPRAEAVAPPRAGDVVALQRAAAVLVADLAVANAARQAVVELPEASKLAQRLDNGFWTRLEAAARSGPAAPVPPR